jgi:aryl-alcohol dehydrogenase-like predicted oxidoreductase
MQYVRLGNCGLMVSRLGLGAMGFGSKSWRGWVLEIEESRAIVDHALRAGINFFDTCDYYSAGRSEEILGEVLLDRVNRADVVLATKVGMNMGPGPNDRGFSRKHLIAAVEASLKRLRTDYIDLYQTHIWDGSTNIEEMMEAFDHLVRNGKVLHIGVADMPAWQFSKAMHIAEQHGWARFVSVQNHYNLVYREDERELLPLCRDQGIGLVCYSPMARGFLAGNRTTDDWGTTVRAKTDDFAQNMYFREADFEVARRVSEVAAKINVQPVQVALAWVLSRPGMTAPIFGATAIDHVDHAVAALDIHLDADDCKYLEQAYQPRPLPGG